MILLILILIHFGMKIIFNEINKMQNFYFSNKLNNILLTVLKKLSFDKNLKGDFKLNKNLLKKEKKKILFILVVKF